MMLNVPLQEVLQLIVSGAISVAREGKCGQLHPVAIQNIPIATNPLPNQGSTCRTRQREVCRHYFRKDVITKYPPELGRGQGRDPLRTEAVHAEPSLAFRTRWL